MRERADEATKAMAKGVTEGFSNKLMNIEIIDPNPIWMAPINDEAVPAFFANGASVSAAVLGFVMPTQDKRIKIKTTVKGK